MKKSVKNDLLDSSNHTNNMALQKFKNDMSLSNEEYNNEASLLIKQELLEKNLKKDGLGGNGGNGSIKNKQTKDNILAQRNSQKGAAIELFDPESTDDMLKLDDGPFGQADKMFDEKKIHQTFRIKKNKELSVRPLRQTNGQNGHINCQLDGNFN